MKVLFVSTNNPGVKFYRFYQFAQKMSELGLAHCRIFPDFEPKRMESDEWELKANENITQIEQMVDWSDIIVCQYIHTPMGLSFVEAMRDKKPTLMEVDDLFSQVPHYSNAYVTNEPGGAGEIWGKRQAMESVGIITTTEYLKKHYQEWNKNVHVIPNCIDLKIWDQYKIHTNGNIRIGWIGGSNHDGDLKLIKDVLFEILDNYPKVEVMMTSVPPPDWKHERFIANSKWVPIDEYPKFVKELSYEIGIAPLKDNEFNRGKSNLRYQEYSACKIPTIASNVEPFRKDFKGILAGSDDEWFEGLSKLIEDVDFRLKLGWNAYYDIQEKFNLESISRKYAEILGGFIDGTSRMC